MTMQTLSPFHLAIPVTDLDKARYFYGQVLGCDTGRTSEQWVDWDFYGHQLVTHKVDTMPYQLAFNDVDKHAVPVPHFGIVLPRPEWDALAERVAGHEIDFIIEPHVRFAGKPGEQATMFFCDPCGNALEFKSFADLSQLFAS